jgi:hypothetical protein
MDRALKLDSARLERKRDRWMSRSLRAEAAGLREEAVRSALDPDEKRDEGHRGSLRAWRREGCRREDRSARRGAEGASPGSDDDGDGPMITAAARRAAARAAAARAAATRSPEGSQTAPAAEREGAGGPDVPERRGPRRPRHRGGRLPGIGEGGAREGVGDPGGANFEFRPPSGDVKPSRGTCGPRSRPGSRLAGSRPPSRAISPADAMAAQHEAARRRRRRKKPDPEQGSGIAHSDLSSFFEGGFGDSFTVDSFGDDGDGLRLPRLGSRGGARAATGSVAALGGVGPTGGRPTLSRGSSRGSAALARLPPPRFVAGQLTGFGSGGSTLDALVSGDFASEPRATSSRVRALRAELGSRGSDRRGELVSRGSARRAELGSRGSTGSFGEIGTVMIDDPR